MKKLTKIPSFSFSILMLLVLSGKSQNIGINSTGATPHNASILDLNTGNTFTSPNGKGFLPPNVALTSRTDITTVTNPPVSLLVYNTTSAGTGTSAVSPGYYYFDGTVWVAFIGPFANSQDWTILGNAGTTPTLNFLGTTDNVDMAFRTNNVEHVRIAANGNVGIGTTNPLNKLEVFGGWNNNINQNGFSGYASSVYSSLSPLHSSHFIGIRARGTYLAPLQPLNGDVLATFQGRGLSGGYTGMTVEAAENQSASALGAKIKFHTVANGTTSIQDRMVIEHDGKVGIGVLSPFAQLDVASSSTVSSDPILNLTRNHPSSTGFLSFHSGSNTGDWSQLVGAGDKSFIFSNDLNPNVDAPTGLVIAPWASTLNPTGGNKGIKIMENGNVGIGAALPSQKLEITDGTMGNSGLRFTNLPLAPVLATNSLGDVISASISTSTSNGLFWSLIGNAGTTPGTHFLGTIDNNDLVFKTNNLERARITSSAGAVCIGTTTPFSPNGSPSKLHISQSTFVHLTNNNYAVYSTFAYNSSTQVIGAFVGAKARGTETSPTYPLANDGLSGFFGRDAIDCYAPGYGGASIVMAASENFSSTNKGTHIYLSTTNTGTNLPTEKMRISANGNVGIGTNAPIFKLHTIANEPNVSVTGYFLNSPNLVSNTGTNYHGSFNVVKPSTAFSFTGTLYGSVNRVETGSTQTGAINNAIGSTNDFYHYSSSNITQAVGGSAVVVNGSSGTITGARGLESSIINFGSGSITDGYGLYIGNIQSTNKWSIYSDDISTQSYIAGRLSIGTPTTSFKFEVVGTTACTGNVWTSDRRKKNNIQKLSLNAIETINKLNPVTYNWNTVIDDGMKGIQMGFIAQEIEEILPDMVITKNDDEKSKSVKYLELLPVLVKAIQEQQTQIESLKNENDKLKQHQQRLNDLEAKVNALSDVKSPKNETVNNR